MFTDHEYRVIARAAQFEDPQPWHVLAVGQSSYTARAARAQLASQRILTPERGRGTDTNGRIYRRTVWRLHACHDTVVQIVEWVRSGQLTPPPWPRDVTRMPATRAIPFGRRPPEDRVLMAILLNPGGSWRDIVRAARCAHGVAVRARSDLLARGAVVIDTGQTITGSGKTYPKSILVPVESDPLVQHFRKELRVEATPVELQRAPPVTVVQVSGDWRAALATVLEMPPENDKRTEPLPDPMKREGPSER